MRRILRHPEDVVSRLLFLGIHIKSTEGAEGGGANASRMAGGGCARIGRLAPDGKRIDLISGSMDASSKSRSTK